ncbi:MAG: hypothetical protein V4515_13155 [Chloroflexota bacterium]
MRPSRTVAIAALTAVLVLGSLPGLVGSHEPSADQSITPAAFREVILAANGGRSTPSIAVADSAYASASRLDAATTFTEPAAEPGPPPADRVSPKLPATPVAWDWKTPRYKISGYASFYDNGTTAMRLPRGTIIVVCGARGCIDRVIRDYGPVAGTGRIIDMYRPDFFAICGCGWWSGTTLVTVSIY